MADLEPSLSHTDAIAALARARLTAAGSALTVYVDQVPGDTDPNPDADDGFGPAFPYAVFWSTPGMPQAEAERLAGWGGEITTSTQATVAGLSERDVLGSVDRLITALHRRKPVMSGRRPGDIEHDGSPGRPQLDPVRARGGRAVYTTALFFALSSSPKGN